MLPIPRIQNHVLPTTSVAGSRTPNRISAHRQARQAGFTLGETLVAVAVMTVLSAVVTPSIINQIRGAELLSMLTELETIGAGIVTFQTDVNRWPLEVNQLIRKPGSKGTDNSTKNPNGSQNLDLVRGNVYPPGLLKKWNGPYLNRATLPPGGHLKTPLSDSIQRVFEVICVNRSDYLAVIVSGVSEVDAGALSLLKDGDENVAINDDAAGVVRWRSSTAPELVFFAATISPPKCN